MSLTVKIKRIGPYLDVQLESFSSTIELGVLDDKERRALADIFIEASDELLEGLVGEIG